MLLSDLAYDLDPSCVAREPSEVRLGRRGLNRMLCVDRKRKHFEDDYVSSLPAILDPGDVLILNDSRRSAGVLFGYSKEGGQVELRLVRQISEHCFTARLFPNHFAKTCAILQVGDFNLRIDDGPGGPHGLYCLTSERPLADLLRAHGLPITSFFYDGYFELANYNPIYASEEGSFESPMAGLHLSQEILFGLQSREIEIAYLTHHVVGSWLSPTTDQIDDLSLAEESYSVPDATSAAVRRAKRSGNRVVAVGSTSVRALESACDDNGVPCSEKGTTKLCIRPGFKFRCVDAYLTSFHPARSSLMVLDVAFCELSLLRDAYKHANAERYMFLEFGDAVLYL
ncbi:S-adenosylmethionine:tRNA ribosyltransferase-isomerase [Burkholderia sp. JP2-270]|uniref:S-adenosylmethionine:tRNA ribosyltransferase-isomerase n=1 Tax=Burkholderia sp. JP2-270 TaxID=2217913 RepID=UPI0013A6DA01|nr:S-adenosylmethionine:tRNA ribosyltransferase-isomerase [Burkholderia sp. JP2-270]